MDGMERLGKVSEAPPVGADAYMQVIGQVLGVPTFPSRSPTRWSRFRLAHFVADGRIGSSNVENPRFSVVAPCVRAAIQTAHLAGNVRRLFKEALRSALRSALVVRSQSISGNGGTR